MSTLEATFHQLPQPILEKLQSMIRRVRRLLFIRGFFATLAVALVCVLTIMGIDALFTLFSSTLRWALTLAGLGITGLAAWWFLFRPLSRKITLTHIARILEIRHPELQERISTAVELMSSEDPDSIRGSEELIEAVVDSAVEDVETFDPKTEFKPVRANKFITLSTICAALIALLLLIWPNQAWTLLTRAIAPFLDIGNAWADSLVIDPGNVRMAKGEPLTITLTADHEKLRRAELRTQLPDGTESVERMTLIGETAEGHKRFSLTLPQVDQDFSYRVRAGSAVSEYFEVEAIPPPEIEQLTIRYDFPEYTQLAPEESSSESGEIRALAYTNVTVTALVNKPVWTSKLLFNEVEELGEATSAGNTLSWTFPLRPKMTGTWQLDLVDGDGFENEKLSYPIQSLPDKPPAIRIESPVARELRLKPTELLPIKYAVTEDFGFSQMDLLVTASGDASPREIIQPTPESDGSPGTWRGVAQLNIGSLDLKPHQNRLTVQIRARDNRPPLYDGPGEGFSEKITITLDRRAESLAEQVIKEQKKQIEQSIREARTELERARDEMKNTEREMQRQEEFSDRAESELEDFNERSEKAEEILQEVAEQFEESIFQQQAEALENIAEEEVAQAQEAADLIPVTDEKQERLAEAKEAREQIEQALQDLKKVEESIRESEQDRNMIAELNDLANEQRALANSAKQEAEKLQQQADQRPQERQLANFQNQQERVQQELGEMLKDNAAALEQALELQQMQAEELSSEAGELAELQEDLRALSEEATMAKNEEAQEKLRDQLLAQLQKAQERIAQETEEQWKQAQQNNPNSNQAAEKATEEEQASESTQQPDSGQNEPAAAEQAESPNSLAEATEQTQQASEKLNAENLSEAKESAQKASKSLAQAAEQAQESEGSQESADKSENNPTSHSEEEALAQNEENSPIEESASDPQSETEQTSPSDALADLAERQAAVSEQLQTVAEGDLQEALAMMEQSLAEEAAALEEDTRQFEETLQNLKQSSAKNKAAQAESALKNAETQAQAASNKLEQAQQAQAQAERSGKSPEGELAQQAKPLMQSSESYQKRAQAFLDQASQALEQSGEAIGQTREGLEPSDMDERITNSDDLAESFQEVTEAAQADDLQQAAQEASEAADSLQQLAQAAMDQLGKIQPGESNSSESQEQTQPQGEPTEMAQHLNENGLKSADSTSNGVPPELQELGISIEDWTKFKGALTSGSATAIETDLPAEYRELVGRYFQVIAKEAKE